MNRVLGIGWAFLAGLWAEMLFFGGDPWYTWLLPAGALICALVYVFLDEFPEEGTYPDNPDEPY